MSNDRYSDDHTITLGKGTKTLSIDGNLEVMGDFNINGIINSTGPISSNLSFTGSISLPSSTTIDTPSGTIDFSVPKSTNFPVSMFFLKKLIDEGYSSYGIGTIDFIPTSGLSGTTSYPATPYYIGRYIPTIKMDPGGYIVLPLHDIIKAGTLLSVKLTCESTVATSIVNPFSFDLEICNKVGTGTFVTTSSAASVFTTSFLENTRREVVIHDGLTPNNINPDTQFAFCTITLNPSFAYQMAVYGITVVADCDPYQALGFEPA